MRVREDGKVFVVPNDNGLKQAKGWVRLHISRLIIRYFK